MSSNKMSRPDPRRYNGYIVEIKCEPERKIGPAGLRPASIGYREKPGLIEILLSIAAANHTAVGGKER